VPRRDTDGIFPRFSKFRDPRISKHTAVSAGRDILDHGKLKRRYTVVPLNKTRANIIPDAKQHAARRATGNRASLALDLVNYDPAVRVAMQYAFGGSLICDDTSAAQKVAFSRDVGCRGISLQGDDFSPAGTLTGGSRGRGMPILSRIAELSAAEEELAQHEVRAVPLDISIEFAIRTTLERAFFSYCLGARRMSRYIVLDTSVPEQG
jgi:chromosome segregation ATPase